MRKIFQRLTSGILTVTMVASLMSVAPYIKAEAEDVLITNGSFEGTTEGWQFTEEDSVTETPQTWGIYDGGYGLEICRKASGEEKLWVNASQTISALSAGNYTLTVHGMGNGGGELKAYAGENWGSVASSSPGWVTTIDDWATATVNFTLDSDVTNFTVGFGFNLWAGGTDKYYVDYVTLEKNISHTLNDLNSLLGTIPDDLEKYNYTSRNALTDPRNTAQTLVDNSSTDADAIESAYNALKAAIDGLTEKATDFDNGDFEAKNTTGWTVGGTISGAGKVEANSGALDASNYFLNVWSATAGTYTISQILTLPAGTYQIGVKNAGDAGVSASTITYQIMGQDAVSKTLKALQGWDTWNETTTDKIVLSEEKDVTVTISVTVAASGYEKIDNVVLTSLDSITLLKNLIASVTDTSDYTEETVSAFESAKEAAQAIVDKGENATEDEINTAYDNLETAINGLYDPDADIHADTNSDAQAVSAGLYVEKIKDLRDDFITGVDVSSVISEYASGVKYYDFEGNELDKQGFFKFLKGCGVNWVRVRVWNNPFDDEGKGYGGGNCDINVAKEIGQYATTAGIKVLVDFHYSDFWTDPGKQMVPKAWKNMDVDEKAYQLEAFTNESMETLLQAGIDVGMVQVGNETNNAICGEDEWGNMAKMFNAGSKAVRAAAAKYSKNILVAIHVANPNSLDYSGYAKNLKDNDVDYDVFASSYYPYFHGTISNLQAKLQAVADTYNKKVMVAETTYLSTWADGDGHPNSRRESTKKSNTFEYDASEQGQADEFRAVSAAIASIKKNEGTDNEKTMGIGVFSWEPAWIPVGNYDTAEDKDSVLESNKQLWETYGSGWASSYSKDYDPDDAGKWYGGSAVDNEAIFDFDGKALESAKMYSYIRTGTTIEEGKANEVLSVFPEAIEETTSLNVKPTVSTDAIVYRRNGDNESASIEWTEEDIDAAITTVGSHIITGKAVVDNVEYPVTFTLIVEPYNYLSNYGFETITNNKPEGWTIADDSSVLNYSDTKDKNFRNGTHSLKFYGENESTFTAVQTVTLNKGVYVCGGWLEGGYNNSNTSDNSFKVYTKIEDGEKSYSSNGEMEGFLNFVKVNAPSLTITEDQTSVEYGIESTIAKGTWGCWDDVYINKDEVASVELYISELENITLDSKEAIDEAREAYDALTEDEQKQVNNYSTLTSAEARLAELKKAKEEEEKAARQAEEKAAREAEEKAVAIQAVVDKITAIGTVTLESEDKITEARSAYDELMEKYEDAVVSNVATLTSAEARLAELKKTKEAEEKAAAIQAVVDKITAIGTVTPESEDKITEARSAYDELMEKYEDAVVSNAATLTSAEARLAELKKAKEEEEKAARQAEEKAAREAEEKAVAIQAVVDKITAIGTVTPESEDKITEARSAYDELMEKYEDAVVSNAATLTSAETRLAELKKAKEEEVKAAREAEEKAAKEEADSKVVSTEQKSTEAVAAEQAIPAATGTKVSTTDASDKATYTVIDSDTDKPVVEYEADDTTTGKKVVIPDTVTDANGVTYAVTKIADNALKDNKNVTTVIIGKNITEIGANAFNNCTKLKKVTVKSSSITKIGAGAFKGDKALTSVDLSKSVVKTIGKNAFSGCKKLKTIKLNGNKLTNVSKGAFKNIKKNATITINAKNKKTYKKVVKLIKKSGAKNVKFKFKKK